MEGERGGGGGEETGTGAKRGTEEDREGMEVQPYPGRSGEEKGVREGVNEGMNDRRKKER